jgi:protein-export membrane protein SecD/preprotein translocase SecF subunit
VNDLIKKSINFIYLGVEMEKLRWRQAVIAVVMLLGVYLAVPTVIYFNEPVEVRTNPELLRDAIPSMFSDKTAKLGLDIQGGVQLVLGVDTEKAVENRLARVGTELMRWAEENSLKVKTAYVVKNQAILRIELAEGQDVVVFKESFKKEFNGLEQSERNKQVIDFVYSDEQNRSIRESATKQALRVIRGRVDKWGVSEPMIAERSDGSIMVQLPGFSDPKRAKELLGRTAQLRFKIVDDKFTGFGGIVDKLPEGVRVDRSVSPPVFTGEDKEVILEFLKDKIPQDREVLFERKELAGGKKSEYSSYVVNAATEISGEDVMDASVIVDSDSFDQRPAVSLKFSGAGGKRFADITGAHVNERMAIVLDDEVISAPNIQQKISGGVARITLGTGNYQEVYDEANQLALILKSGALPARITIEEERQVGATLGPELAKEGILAVGVGLLLVLVFMVIFYGQTGLIANVALVLNGLLLLAGMTVFGFAMTLPGIAGFILTLGMAVDANVLINERIRQELRSGKMAKKAVEAGFGRVFWTIVDSNVTTLIAALVLLETSTSGPIRGFAVTLILGLSVSMFTALYCSRTFFAMALMRKRSESDMKKFLSGGFNRGRDFGFDILGRGRVFTIACIVAAVAGVMTMSSRGMNWSVDFAGGTEMEIEFASQVGTDFIRDTASKAGVENVVVQQVGANEDRRYVLRFENAKASSEGTSAEDNKVQRLSDEFLAAFTTNVPKVLRVDFVGPQVGKELQKQGAASLFYALIGILIYILLRFDMRFGPGAIVKMIVDVSIVLAFYSLGWISFDLTSVAALLTVIGYSINDAIVIFDRVRENIVMFPRRELFENINISINETLSRAINTSVTTLISLLGVLLFGTSQIWNFAAAMAVGIVIATLSSIFIACPFIVWTEQFRDARDRKKAAAAT